MKYDETMSLVETSQRWIILIRTQILDKSCSVSAKIPTPSSIDIMLGITFNQRMIYFSLAYTKTFVGSRSDDFLYSQLSLKFGKPGQGQPYLVQRTLIYFVSGSINVRLTSCFVSLDSAALLKLN